MTHLQIIIVYFFRKRINAMYSCWSLYK